MELQQIQYYNNYILNFKKKLFSSIGILKNKFITYFLYTVKKLTNFFMKTIIKLNNIILNLFCIYFCFGQVLKKVISLKIKMIFMYR